MTISYSFAVENGLMIVTAAGSDDSVQEVMDYGVAIIAAAVASNCTRVLCDERDLTYRLGTLDTFQSAQYLAEQAPRVARAAIVCKPAHYQDASFWETVAVNRGLIVRVFQERAAAELWLAQQA